MGRGERGASGHVVLEDEVVVVCMVVVGPRGWMDGWMDGGMWAVFPWMDRSLPIASHGLGRSQPARSLRQPPAGTGRATEGRWGGERLTDPARAQQLGDAQEEGRHLRPRRPRHVALEGLAGPGPVRRRDRQGVLCSLEGAGRGGDEGCGQGEGPAPMMHAYLRSPRGCPIPAAPATAAWTLWTVGRRRCRCRCRRPTRSQRRRRRPGFVLASPYALARDPCG